jgi:lysophospholipase L1-like esterase
MGKALRRTKRVLVLLQAGWSILGITLVVLLLTEAGFRAAFALKDRLGIAPRPDRRVLVEGYGGATWPVRHYRELEALEDRWEPYVYFRQKPFRGTTISIDAKGLRATWQPPSPALDGHPDRKPAEILMLGGSSLWGFGARDDETIPSLLARELYKRKSLVRIRNLSEIGYVNTQEVIALCRELQTGYRPDVVIFYDGVNDTTSALLEGESGLTTNEINRRNEFNLLKSPARLATALIANLVRNSASYRFAQAVGRRNQGETLSSSHASTDQTLNERSDGVVSRYAANVRLVEALGRGYGFFPLFFWQPVIFTKSRLAGSERQEAGRYAWAEPFFREVYQRARASIQLRGDPAFYDLSGTFADNEDLVYIDYCHTTESANARLASEMADAVMGALKRSTPESRGPGR